MSRVVMQPMNPQSLATQPRPPIRRAVYIHVSDLTSAYNIDHKKLQNELSRVQSVIERLSISSPTDPGDESVSSVPQKRLQPPRGGYNLCVLVGKVNVVVDKLRVDRSRVRLAEVEVGDETGIVSLRGRDEQIDLLKQVSQQNGAVVLRNCTLELFQGKHIRLAITKWGKLTTYPDDVASTPPPPSKINVERNFSLIDLSLVASEMVENTPPEGYPVGQMRETMNQDRTRLMGARQQHFQPPRQFQHLSRPVTGLQPSTRRQPPSRQRNMGINPQSMTFPEASTFGYAVDPSRYPIMQPAYGYGEMPPLFPHGAQQGQHQPSQPQQAHLLLHQYEMQQRQMHQQHMRAQAYHEQQGRQQAMIQRSHQMQSSAHIVPNVRASSSFDTQGDYSPRGQQMSLAQTGMPMQGGMPVQSERPGSSVGPTFPVLGHSPEGLGEMQSHFLEQSVGGQEEVSEDHGTWGYHDGQGPEDQTMSPGKMNPRAIVFAPSYGETQQQEGGPGQQVGPQMYGYPYVPGQLQGSHYPHHPHPDYGMVYMPMQAGPPVTSNESSPDREPDSGDDQHTPNQPSESRT